MLAGIVCIGWPTDRCSGRLNVRGRKMSGLEWSPYPSATDRASLRCMKRAGRFRLRDDPSHKIRFLADNKAAKVATCGHKSADDMTSRIRRFFQSGVVTKLAAPSAHDSGGVFGGGSHILPLSLALNYWQSTSSREARSPKFWILQIAD